MWDGGNNDKATYKKSSMGRNPTNFFHNNTFGMADGGFVGSPDIVIPHQGAGLSQAQTDWNERFSNIRQLVECTFALLKGRWRMLHRSGHLTSDFRAFSHAPDVANVYRTFIINAIFTAIILHNLIVRNPCNQRRNVHQNDLEAEKDIEFEFAGAENVEEPIPVSQDLEDHATCAAIRTFLAEHWGLPAQ
jgi:hypothetical protein